MPNPRPTPIPIADAARLVGAVPVPVVIVDTCSILDVMRAPLRRDIPNGVVDAASTLVARFVASPREMWLVTAEVVLGEWDDHADDIERQVAEQARHVDNLRRDFDEARRHVSGAAVPPVERLVESGIAADLRRLSRRLVDHAVIPGEDPALMTRAWTRHRAGLRPSERGRQEYADCVIVEHTLAFCQLLCEAGNRQPRDFVSSNKRDYCLPGGSHLHPDLAPEFAAVQLRFGTSLADALRPRRPASAGGDAG